MPNKLLDPAFVVHYLEDGKQFVHPGLSKREYAAIQIAAAYFVGHGSEYTPTPEALTSYAKISVAFADSLLAELAK